MRQRSFLLQLLKWALVPTFIGALAVVMVPNGVAQAQTWISTAGGDYFVPGNWSGGVAQGAGATADFNTLDITSDLLVTLNSPLTIGNMIFGDTNTASGGSWGIETTTVPPAIITLDNGGSKPALTANETTSLAFDDTFIGNSIAGTMGFRKLGVGILTLGPGTANTITGGIDVEEGTLRLQATIPAQAVTLANGTTLETAGSHNNGVAVPEGATVTYTTTATATVGNLNAPGTTATLNLNLNTAGSTISPGGAMTGFQTINFTGVNGLASVRLVPNNSFGGAPPAFVTTSFANTHVHLDNAQLLVRSNSQGNLIPIGELTGTATGVLTGGQSGTAARYQLGDVDDTYTYAGIINGNGGISINKVGTGTITFSGTIVGGTNGSTAVNSTPARQGGVFRVTAGTLAITGQNTLPGGPAANPTILTTIDVLPGATFDVSGSPGGTFTTSAQQKVQGGGRILGNYSHPAGFINPADVGAPTAANEDNLSSGVTPTAGTITFDGDFGYDGGTIVYDMSLDPNSGNDLVHVTGNVAFNSGRILPNFLNGVPSGGSYTVMTWDGSVTGAASNIFVDFPGRTPNVLTQQSGNSLVFTPIDPVPGEDLIWTGSTNGNWDAEATQNWTNDGSPDQFFDTDSVTFPEGAATQTVVVTQVVVPESVTINNSTPYSFTGTGSIIGATGLTKSGSGMLTMQVANTFTGAASVEGNVDVGAFGGALGTGQLTLNNTTLLATANGISNSEVIVPDASTSTIQGDGASSADGLGNTFNLGAISGGGTLTLTSTLDNKAFGTGVTNNFTGTLNIMPSGAAVTLGAIRIRGGQTTFPNAVVNITGARISNQQGAAAGTTATIEFGELHGDSTTSLVAFEGGSAPPNANWQIGNLGTNSNFDGVIADGAGAAGAPSLSNVTKVGGGILTVSALNTYTGDTSVQGGILRTTNNTVLPDATDVLISAGAMLDLMFNGNDDVNALYFGGVPQAAGLYGAGNSGGLITGTGMLNVLTMGPVLGVPGDYNGNNVVDAADYTFWRDRLGQNITLPNTDPADVDGMVTQAEYTFWKANFGATLGSGAGSLSSQIGVPEPTSLVLLSLAGLALATRRRQR